ncbi:MAG: hypothetical protein ACE5JQ_18040 [Candidatus Methylomirabilales bacterium]
MRWKGWIFTIAILLGGLGVALISGVLLHVYVATGANPGSFKAMVPGRMDGNLVRVHHPNCEPISGVASATWRSQRAARYEYCLAGGTAVWYALDLDARI